jgi:hypothetical protein
MQSIKWLPGFIGLVILALVLTGGVALAQTGNGYDLSWWTVDGGGGASSGGGYTLIGTSGQADAGVLMSGGNYTLAGGFWGVGGLAQSPEGNPIYLPIVFKEH